MKGHDFSGLRSIYINCTLKKSPETSHTSTLIQVSKSIMEREKVEEEETRLVDHDIARGIYPDMKEHGWKKRMNGRLNLMAEDAGVTTELRTYSIRHSWASITKYAGIPTTLISEGLGHSSV